MSKNERTALVDLAFDVFGRDPAIVRRVQPVLDVLVDKYFRVAAEGLEHVPDGPAILVANHGGAIPWDALVMSTLLARKGRTLRPLIEDAVMSTPIFGWFMNRCGSVRASRENALRLLDRGEPIIVFPEGGLGLGKSFRRRYQLQRFGRGGFIKLALRSGAPLVPVGIVGQEDTAPLFAKLPVRFGRTRTPYVPLTPALLPARWAVRVLPAIDARARADLDDPVSIASLSDEIRELLQSTVNELLELRPGVYS